MTEEDRRILSVFASSVRNRYPEARIWAFGSRVTGSLRKNQTWMSVWS